MLNMANLNRRQFITELGAGAFVMGKTPGVVNPLRGFEFGTFAENLSTNEREFFVAAQGDDSNPGTKDRPFKSLLRARDAIRDLKKKQPSGDLTVFIRGGAYTLAETIIFDLRDSGKPDQKITYKAYPGERPIFTSGRKIEDWKPLTQKDLGYSFLPLDARKHVWVAPLPAEWTIVRNLVDQNANWLDRARIGITKFVTTQHSNSIDAEMWDPPEKKKVQEYSKSMRGLSNIDNALELRIYPSDWNMNLLPVLVIKENKLFTKVPGTYRLAIPWVFFKGFKGDLCWIENLLEGLNAPGKWVCDMKSRQLYVWPMNGVPDIQAPRLTEFIRVEGHIDYWGSTDTPVQYLKFEGLTFVNGERAVWQEGDSGIQHDWGMADKANALLRFRGAANCTVTDCTFAKSGGTGVRFDLFAQSNVIDRCRFEFLGYEAVHFCGYGIGTKDVNKNNKLLNSEIHHVGQIKWDSPAVIVWNSSHNQISSNHIHHTANKGVLLSAPRSWAFTPQFPTREQAWPMARWWEIPPKAQMTAVIQHGIRTIPIDDDKICSHYRYLKGNVVERNTLHHVSQALRGDSVFYMSATAFASSPEEDYNKILFNYIHDTDGGSTGVYRAVYIDGFVNSAEINENVWQNCEFWFEIYALYTWFDPIYPSANVFINVISKNKGPFFAGKKTHPKGNLIWSLGNAKAPYNRPRVEFLPDYQKIYRNLDSVPQSAQAEEARQKLAKIIRVLMGKLPAGNK